MRKYPFPYQLLSILFLCGAFSSALFAQTDTYYNRLQQKLQSENGLTGGKMVFGANEKQVLESHTKTPGVLTKLVAVSGQPFLQALNVRNPQRGKTPKNRHVRFTIQENINQGDILLLILWVKGIQGERLYGHTSCIVEQNHQPFKKSLNHTYHPGAEWQQLVLPFEAKANHPALQADFLIYLGYQKQELEIAGLALLNFGSAKYTLNDMPRSTPHPFYSGWQKNAPWRQAAYQRIEKHRKGMLTVQVQDANRQPIPGATVAVKMHQHEFGFGTAVRLPFYVKNKPAAKKYREKVWNVNGDGRTFNLFIPENSLKWPFWERFRWPISHDEIVAFIKQARERGIKIRGHDLLWGGWVDLPRRLKEHSSDPIYIRKEIRQRVLDMAGYEGLKGNVNYWNVINEPLHKVDLERVFNRPPGYLHELAELFRLAKEADPRAKTYVNEYGFLSNGGMNLILQERYRKLVREIEKRGGPVDGVSFQAHMNVRLTPPEVVYQILEEFAVLGKEMGITEYDVVGVNEKLAGDYLRDFLTIIFSYPKMNHFNMWGFWDGAQWLNNAPMFDKKFRLKPAGKAFLDLVFNEWWTSETGRTNSAGELAVNGFFGTYDIEVQYNGRTETKRIQHTALGQPAKVVIDF